LSISKSTPRHRGNSKRKEHQTLSREWKIDLIVSMNPDWRDLYDEIAV